MTNRIYFYIKQFTALLAITIVLAACGGGGGAPATDQGTGFNKAAGFSGEVQSIVVANDSSGDAYIGGSFVSYNKTSVNGLVRLNGDGSIDKSFDTMTDGGFAGEVASIALATDGSGDVYIGGKFSSYNGTEVNHLLRLNRDGSVDSGFDTGLNLQGRGFNGQVFSVALANDGTGDVYIGGEFTFYNNIAVNYLVRLNSDGSIDSGFDTQSGGGLDGIVVKIIPDSNGDVYVAGWFTSYNNIAASSLVRFNNDGSIDSGFDATTSGGFGSSVHSLALATDNTGDIFVGGWFTSYKGVAVNKLVRLDSTGSLVNSAFNTANGVDADLGVFSITPTTDGSGDIYIGGQIFEPKKNSYAIMMRLASDGSISSSFKASIEEAGFYIVLSIALAVDGSDDVYIGGGFASYKGVAVNHLLRLNSDGSIDADSGIKTGSGIAGTVQDIDAAVDGSEDIFVSGNFRRYNGTTVDSLIRLNKGGNIQTSFNAAFNNGPYTFISSIAFATDGSGDLYAGGNLDSVRGSVYRYVMRLNSDGSVDNGFSALKGASSGNYVTDIVVDVNGDVYAGGSFTDINGVFNDIVRLKSDGSIDSSFVTGSGTDDFVEKIILTTDGSGDVYIAGNFTNYNGTAVNRLIRLNHNGSIDSAFNVGSGFNSSVKSLMLATDGSGDLYVGGRFSSYNGIVANNLVRLNSDGSIDGAFDVQTGGGFTDAVDSLAFTVDGSGDIYIGGLFPVYNGITVNGIVRLNANGSIDKAFEMGKGFNGSPRTKRRGLVFDVLPLADGSGDVYAGGAFGSYNGVTVDGIVRLGSGGTLDD